MTNSILAITTCRVSSPEQMESNSLDRQRDAVLDAAKKLGATIPEDGQWSGSVSSKAGTNTRRKDLVEMLEYCKRNPRVKYLIVHEVDRFMRSLDELFYFEVTFRETVGVTIYYASQPELNNGDYYSKLLKALEAFKGEGSNVERQKKSIDGQTKALKQGRYTFAPKPGYMRGIEKGIPVIHPDRGPALRRVLKKLANGLVTPTQALIELNDSDFTKDHSKYKMDKFSKIATDPFYAGIVEVQRQVKVRNENGLHEPLLTLDEHYRLISIMTKRPKYQNGPNKKGNPEFPLNGILVHEECVNYKNHGRAVGYNHGNGQNPNLVYKKYRCRSCNKYWHLAEVNQKVIDVFDMYELDEKFRHELVNALEIVWKKNQVQVQQEIARIRHSKESLKAEIKRKVLSATDPSNSSIKKELLSIIEDNKQQLEKLEEKLFSLTKAQSADQKEFMEFALNFIENTSQHFLQEYVSRQNRLKCKQLIFPAGFLINQKNKVYTPEVSIFYRLATKKKSAKASENSHLVQHS